MADQDVEHRLDRGAVVDIDLLEQDRVARRLGLRGDPIEGLRDAEVPEPRHDDPEDPGSATHEAPGRGARAVVGGGDRRLDERPGGRCHVGTTVQHAGHGLDRHAAGPGDLADGGPSGEWHHAPSCGPCLCAAGPVGTLAVDTGNVPGNDAGSTGDRHRDGGSPMARYSIGVDFGTAAGRAVLVDVADGTVVATALSEYRSGVIDEHLPAPDDAVRLGPDWALQDPDDYLRVLQEAVPAVLRSAGVDPADVI